MEPFPLTTLLALRQREEEAAEREWSAALVAFRGAEARLAALAGEVAAARARLDQARGEAGAPWTAAEVAARERFVVRRRDEWKAAAAAEAEFRAGPLAAARGAEALARQDHAEKRRGREAVEKQKEQWQAQVQRQQERRAEDARDDVTTAARHHKTRDA